MNEDTSTIHNKISIGIDLIHSDEKLVEQQLKLLNKDFDERYGLFAGAMRFIHSPAISHVQDEIKTLENRYDKLRTDVDRSLRNLSHELKEAQSTIKQHNQRAVDIVHSNKLFEVNPETKRQSKRSSIGGFFANKKDEISHDPETITISKQNLIQLLEDGLTMHSGSAQKIVINNNKSTRFEGSKNTLNTDGSNDGLIANGMQHMKDIIVKNPQLITHAVGLAAQIRRDSSASTSSKHESHGGKKKKK